MDAQGLADTVNAGTLGGRPATAHPPPASRQRGSALLERSCLVALVALPASFFLAVDAAIYVRLPLGRDQMIFHYVAWAVQQGERLYSDIRDVNGPLISLMHLGLHRIGADGPAGLRVLDLAVSALVFAAAGSVLPGLTRPSGARRAGLWTRAAWAVAGCAALLAAYFQYDFWYSAQRDGLYFCWALASYALHVQVRSARLPLGFWVAVGVPSGAICLGKPSFVVFAGLQLLVLALDSTPRRERARELACFIAGCLLGALGLAALSGGYADLGHWLRFIVHDVPAVYRYLPAQPLAALWTDAEHGRELWAAVATTALFVAWAWRASPPRSAWLFGLLPLPAIANLLLQSKGFGYHYVPVSLAWRLSLLGALAIAWRAADTSHAARSLAVALTVGLGVWVTSEALTSPHRHAQMLLEGERASAFDAFLARASDSDWQPLDERAVAEHLRDTTAADARVQVIGMDPSILFQARRLSATPYIYAWDVVLEEAQRGAAALGAGPEVSSTIRAIERERIADFQRRLMARPPAKLVLAELMEFFGQSAEQTLQQRCPELWAWLETHYAFERAIGIFRVYGLRASHASRPGHVPVASADPWITHRSEVRGP